MIKRIFKKNQFNDFIQWLDCVAFREPGIEHYNVRLNIENRLYWLRLQVDVYNIMIYVLSAAEVITENGEEIFLPVLKNKNLKLLFEALVFIVMKEDAG